MDHQVNALTEHVELRVGDEHGDLDEHVPLEIEAGHLAVDPDEVIVHWLALRSGRGSSGPP
jgi:hypothetical protein